MREFLDRFSLPRVVRLEGTGGRPVLLYKQQQRSLRVTASLLMHRYRHDVKVGPEIVIPEGYPGGFLEAGGGRGGSQILRISGRGNCGRSPGPPRVIAPSCLSRIVIPESGMTAERERERGPPYLHERELTIEPLGVSRKRVLLIPRRCSHALRAMLETGWRQRYASKNCRERDERDNVGDTSQFSSSSSSSSSFSSVSPRRSSNGIWIV